MEIKLYNSLTKKMEVFKPINENILTMYVCGPTVYNHMHIGNGRPVVFFDTVRRFFEHIGYKVLYVSNFTDIDDKIIKAAKAENITELEVSNKYIDAYNDVVRRLNCKPNYLNPRVTECMDDIVNFIEELVNKDHAYTKGDDTYFRVRSIDNYGMLSGQKVDDLKAGARIDVSSDKEDNSDFILWKKTSDDGIKWSSCLGDGRPGWHTECVVMIDKIFKGMIDIHGGGNDLKFPHHENEIAQSIALHNHSIANYWLHNARVDLNGEKMSKSLGNVIWLKDLITEYSPNAYRLMILNSGYRQSINYSPELIQSFQKEWDKIERVYVSLYRKLEQNNYLDKGNLIEEKIAAFDKSIANDFNFANGITAIYEINKEINKEIRSGQNLELLANLFKTLNEMLEVLGLIVDIKPLTEEEKTLVNEWTIARQNKDFEKADLLRKQITELGIKM